MLLFEIYQIFGYGEHMKIYLEIFQGELVGWGSSQNGVALENMPTIDIDENHPFFENPRKYIFDFGQLKEKINNE